MNGSVKQLNGKVWEWAKLIFITGGAQVVVQVTALLCGIIVIRLLPTKEYAMYTLANTMLGTMTLLADGGISSGVMAQGGKVWQDRQKLGSVLATGLYLRKKFAVVSLAISVPVLLYLLLHQGANIWWAVVIVVTLIPSFYAALSDSMLEVGPKLHQSIRPLQANQMMVGLGRLLLTAVSTFFFPFTAIALLAIGIPRIYGNIKLKGIAQQFADDTSEINPEAQKDILSGVKRMLPESIYYCLSGQLNIWLLSLFGSTMALASLGAINRLSMLLNFISILYTTLIVPRFVRLTENRATLLKYFTTILVGMIALNAVIVLLTALFSSNLLWLLGNKYQGLDRELVLSILGSCIGLITGTSYMVLINKGWAINPVLYIVINLATTALAAMFINVSSLTGVLIFNIVINIVQAVTLGIYCFYKISKVKTV